MPERDRYVVGEWPSILEPRTVWYIVFSLQAKAKVDGSAFSRVKRWHGLPGLPRAEARQLARRLKQSAS